jgi:phosphonate transport system permease protein
MIHASAQVDADPLMILLQRIEEQRRAKQRITAGYAGIFAAILVLSVWWTGFSLAELLNGFPQLGGYIVKMFTTSAGPGSSERIPIVTLSHFFGDADTKQSLAYWFFNFRRFFDLIVETVLMAILATLMGFTLAFALSFPASRNLVHSAWIVWVCRRVMEVLRSIPDLVFALFFVFCYGIGPIAGILAMGLHTAGALGKLFSELNENASTRPIEGMNAVGADWFKMLRYAVVPQVLPGFISYTLLRFEINIRSSAIIGVVGAGGIGSEIKKVINFNQYEDVSAVIIMVVVLVILMDMISGQIRHRFIGTPRFG